MKPESTPEVTEQPEPPNNDALCDGGPQSVEHAKNQMRKTKLCDAKTYDEND